MPENRPPLPGFARWPSFPFEGDMRVKRLAPPVQVEPPRSGEEAADCVACNTPDDEYIWVSERWRVRAMDQPTGLPVVLVLECRSHLDLGDLTNLLAAELGVMTVRVERAIRSLDGVARVHVNRWGDGAAHLHLWFLARPYGRLQLRGTFLSLWDDILPPIPERQWRENLGHVAALLAEFGGTAIAEPPHIVWQAPGTMGDPQSYGGRPHDLSDVESSGAAEAPDETAPDGTAPDETAPDETVPDGGARGAPDGAEDRAPGAGDEAGDPPPRGEPGQDTVDLLDRVTSAASDDQSEATTHNLAESARRVAAGGSGEDTTHDLSASARRASSGGGSPAGSGGGSPAGSGGQPTERTTPPAPR